jgi:DNA-binding transcriptional regulator YdaS (Cro superfamily)
MVDETLDAVLARHGRKPADLIAAGFSQRMVNYWRRGDRPISVGSAQLIEQHLGIPKHELRPDVWPPPPNFRKGHTKRGNFNVGSAFAR